MEVGQENILASPPLARTNQRREEWVLQSVCVSNPATRPEEYVFPQSEEDMDPSSPNSLRLTLLSLHFKSTKLTSE